MWPASRSRSIWRDECESEKMKKRKAETKSEVIKTVDFVRRIRGIMVENAGEEGANRRREGGMLRDGGRGRNEERQDKTVSKEEGDVGCASPLETIPSVTKRTS